MTIGVYAIRNTFNGKVYVGSSHSSIEERWAAHRNGVSSSPALQRDIELYGVDAFEFTVLEEFPDLYHPIRQAELKWIDHFGQERVYNLQPFLARRPWSAERRALQAAANAAWRERKRAAEP